MRKVTAVILICAMLLILPACAQGEEHTEKCKAAYEALANANAIHYTRVTTTGIEQEAHFSTTSRAETWICGADYLHFSNIDEAYDAAYWDVQKDGVSYEFSWGEWTSDTAPIRPSALWDSAAWDDLQMKFRSATEEAGKLTVTFDAGGDLSFTVAFCFDPSGSLESITTSSILAESNSHVTQEDLYTILSYDEEAIQKTIDDQFAAASAQ